MASRLNLREGERLEEQMRIPKKRFRPHEDLSRSLFGLGGNGQGSIRRSEVANRGVPGQRWDRERQDASVNLSTFVSDPLFDQ